VVLDVFEYKDTLNNLLKSGVYELLPKEPRDGVEKIV
jgi:hypothetical protein